VYGSDVARARAKQSAARLLNSSDSSDMAAPRRVGGGGVASNHHLVLFTHALCQLSYPVVTKGSNRLMASPLRCLRVRFAVGTCFSRHCRSRGPGRGLVRVILGQSSQYGRDHVVRVYQGQSQTNIGLTAEIRSAWHDGPLSQRAPNARAGEMVPRALEAPLSGGPPWTLIGGLCRVRRRRLLVLGILQPCRQASSHVVLPALRDKHKTAGDAPAPTEYHSSSTARCGK
jgi:hypothetical protein